MLSSDLFIDAVARNQLPDQAIQDVVGSELSFSTVPKNEIFKRYVIHRRHASKTAKVTACVGIAEAIDGPHPLNNAAAPSSRNIVRKQSNTPVYLLSAICGHTSVSPYKSRNISA